MTAKPTKPEPILWLNDARGIYIPRDFATSFKERDKYVTSVNDEDWAVLEAGPDHVDYWDTWQEVEMFAHIINDDGVVFTVHHDGDVWLIPEGMIWDEESDWFVWPDE
jgi:hypothetical protein